MKKTTIKKPYVKPDYRAEWKDKIDDLFLEMMEEMDELEPPKEMILAIEKVANKFKDKIKDECDTFEITKEIVMEDDEVFNDILFDMTIDKINVSDYQREYMIEITSKDGLFIKAANLSQLIRVEALMQEFEENPYQLKLIA